MRAPASGAGRARASVRPTVRHTGPRRKPLRPEDEARAMDSGELYRWLMTGGPSTACDRFDAHVIASSLSLALIEGAQDGRTVSAAMGLEGATLTAFVGGVFPHAR